MKNNLIFTNLIEHKYEDVERKLRIFLQEQLGIDYHVEIGNTHRFGKRVQGKIRPIVARFIYHKDLSHILEQATWLKNTPYGVHQQFPKDVEDRRKKLYPVQKEARRQGKRVALIRDKLFIDGEQYIGENNSSQNDETINNLKLVAEPGYPYRDRLLSTPKEGDRPYKRQRQSDSSPNPDNVY